ncbi:MAG: carotenoid biosynthesis protein [Verrucomicrobia bacterium]|nr:carotenoid biosynthesis protein [Verrucomicrobiota bacterium]MBV8277121.1 carotenoid biosynthesis protein [Verrucomicrobiota bacterium]
MREWRFLLWILLLLYLLARVLQLFPGTVPNLLIVGLHVVPPALFALIHGARVYGSRGALVFAGLCLSVGIIFESLSLRTGFPFGQYEFTDLMGPRLFDLPVLLALAYLGMGYLSWVIGLLILRYENVPLSGAKLILLPAVASLIMTTWDLSMEPVWADIDRAWVWRDGGAFYGVPITNFFGWLLTAYVFYQLFALYLRRREVVSRPANNFRLAIPFFGLSAIGNLLVVVPGSLKGIFVDASGTSWALSQILWTSRLISIFVCFL